MGLFDDADLPAEGWIRDTLGNNVARIRHEYGRAVLQDRLGNRLGVYDPSQDRTYDTMNNVIGRGNWLGTLFGRRR